MAINKQEIHNLVDQLGETEIEALYRILILMKEVPAEQVLHEIEEMLES